MVAKQRQKRAVQFIKLEQTGQVVICNVFHRFAHKNSHIQALKAGFITPYASSAVDEDFVELIAVYVTNTEAYWQSRIKTAGTTGAPIINSKFEIVYNYMLDTWNIDLDILRNTVLDHQNRIGELDLDEL